eukprot:751799-Hanusia_phi.AAC.3
MKEEERKWSVVWKTEERWIERTTKDGHEEGAEGKGVRGEGKKAWKARRRGEGLLSISFMDPQLGNSWARSLQHLYAIASSSPSRPHQVDQPVSRAAVQLQPQQFCLLIVVKLDLLAVHLQSRQLTRSWGGAGATLEAEGANVE